MYYTIPSNGFEFISNKYNKIYYYDPVSNKGQWTPFNLNYTINLPEDWIIYQGKSNVYFYNQKTKKQQYKIPENTVINPLQGIGDPMLEFYIKNGLPLEDYNNTIVGLNKIGIVIPRKHITKITDGCQNISDINQMIDYLLEHSPNITEIDLSNCEITPEIQEKLKNFPKLQVVISTKRLKLISPSYPDYLTNEEFDKINSYPKNAFSMIKNWDQFFPEYLDSLNGRNDIDCEWNKWTDMGWDATSIIKGLLATGHNPQKGYDDFIDTIINGNRYSRELWDDSYGGDISSIDLFLKLFFEYRAEPKLDRLLRPERLVWVDSDGVEHEENIQDEENYANIKGILIDTLYKLNSDYVSNEKLNIYLPTDWNSIKPEYWQETDNEDYEDSSSFLNQFWEHMKYFSKILRDYKK